MTHALQTSDRDGHVIERVAKSLNLAFEVDEPHHYVIDAFELYGPQHEDSTAGKWDLYIATVIRGVWRTANGDGWPDDVDVALHSSYDKAEEAVKALVLLYVAGLIDGIAEGEDEAIYYAEMKAQGLYD